jgi:uncharacterized membrane protein
MSKEKRIEQEIGWYKVIFVILTVSGLSLLSWLAQNFENAKPAVLILSLASVVAVIVAIYLINNRVFKCLDKLEEL